MQELYNILFKNKLTPNQLYLLHSIREKVIPSNLIQVNVELRKLEINNWIDVNKKLTKESIILLDEVNLFFKKTKKKTSVDILGDDFIEKITQYVELFPNKKLSSGKYARVNVKNLETTFKWFFENYNYDWDTILNATVMYINDFATKNYEFMRTSQYFIRKQNIDKTFDSDLATYCELINTEYDNDHDTFKEIVV